MGFYLNRGMFPETEAPPCWSCSTWSMSPGPNSARTLDHSLQ
jgi:hypothetical protein